MAKARRKPMRILDDVEEDLVQRLMFAEYREENSKDMEREALGTW